MRWAAAARAIGSPAPHIPSPASTWKLYLAQTEKNKRDRRRVRETDRQFFGSPVGIRGPTPLHPNQQQLKAWIFLAWNQICSPTSVPGRLWKKKQPPNHHHHQIPSSQKEEEIQLQKCVVEKKKKKEYSRGHGNCKGTDFFKAENGPCSPDIGKRHFNKTMARKFGIFPPQGCGVHLLAILQIQALFSLSLPSKSTFYTCSHVGMLDPWKPHADKQTNNHGLRCVCECSSVCRGWQVCTERTACLHQVWGTLPNHCGVRPG